MERTTSLALEEGAKGKVGSCKRGIAQRGLVGARSFACVLCILIDNNVPDRRLLLHTSVHDSTRTRGTICHLLHQPQAPPTPRQLQHRLTGGPSMRLLVGLSQAPSALALSVGHSGNVRMIFC